jgi:CRP-like cAMP-binding protein
VELSHAGEPLTTVHKEEVLGASLLEDSDPMQTIASAVEDTRLRCIGREDFFELLAGPSEITAIVSTLVKRFRKVVE